MSLRNLLKRHLPSKEKLQAHGSLNFLAEHLHDPNIWHIHKRSLAAGAAVGIFCAFIPAPIQTVTSAVLAILFRVNLPIAVVFSFFSNPVTIPPLFFYAHKIGAFILGTKHRHVEFHFSLDWLSSTFLDIWQPLLIGCFIMAAVSSILTYVLIRLIWRYTAINKWLNRKRVRDSKQSSDM